jgi:hypothetical protein
MATTKKPTIALLNDSSDENAFINKTREFEQAGVTALTLSGLDMDATFRFISMADALYIFNHDDDITSFAVVAVGYAQAKLKPTFSEIEPSNPDLKPLLRQASVPAIKADLRDILRRQEAGSRAAEKGD